MPKVAQLLLIASSIFALTMFAGTGSALALDLVEDHQDIEGPFKTGPEVTEACLECHDDVAH
ncbi:hypothetical protein CSB20_14335, partial [bacterium DOLZORAL124_64_63]